MTCWRVLALAAVFAAVLASGSSAAEKVVLQLRWDHQFQFAGYYAALWNGHYERAGLDVEIRSSFPKQGQGQGQGLSAVKEVAEGRAEFGIAAADVLVARDKGIPLVVLASVFQSSPVRVFLRREVPFKDLGDLLRLKLAFRPGELSDIEMQAMLRSEGVDPSGLVAASTQPGMRALADPQIDGTVGYNLGLPFLAEKAGYDLKEVSPASYGVNFYGDSLFARFDLVDANPELVQSFVEASMQGWTDALSNPQPIIDRLLRDLPRVLPMEDPAAYAQFQMERVRELTNYPQVQPGHINPARWNLMNELLRREGLVSKALDLDGFIYDLAHLQRLHDEREEKALNIAVVAAGAAVVLIGIWVLFRLRQMRRTVAARTGELTLSQQRFRGVLENAGDSIFIHDLDGNMLSVNRDARDRLGYGPEDVARLTVFDVGPPRVERERLLALWRGLEVNRPVTIDGRLARRDGSSFPVEIRLACFFEGNEKRVVAIARDVTERRRQERELVQARDRAEASVAAKNAFLANMSHELRTPLNAIMGFSQAMLSGIFGRLPNTRFEEYLGDIERSAMHLLQLIDDLLDLSSIQAGTEQLHEADIDVRALVDDAVSMMRGAMADAGVDLRTELAQDLPKLRADERRLRQILLNLLSNANKFAANSAVWIGVTVLGDGSMELQVRDNGGGMTEKDVATALETFGQVESPFARRHHGMGLGLPICHRLMELHGGTLQILSTGGRGTTVIARFPPDRVLKAA